jgi:diguanylate cyclase (GGDEF)-like protein
MNNAENRNSEVMSPAAEQQVSEATKRLRLDERLSPSPAVALRLIPPQFQSSADSDSRIAVLEHRIEALEVQTQRDATTGLYNRAYLERKLESEFTRALYQRSVLSLVFIDVDQFKVVNDTHGHSVGDQVLIIVARRMLSAARQTDTVARYGGEEFVMLLPDTNLTDARVISERMLVSVRSAPCLTRDGASVTTTFSAGIAALEPDNQAFGTPAALLDAADQMLYKAKDAGRGRIAVHDANA